MLPRRPYRSDDQGGGHPGATPRPWRREHGPAHLADRLVAPGPLPAPTQPTPSPVAASTILNDPSRAPVARLALGDLLRRLGAAEVRHHRRVPDEPLQQRQVVLAPRLQAHVHRREPGSPARSSPEGTTSAS